MSEVHVAIAAVSYLGLGAFIAAGIGRLEPDVRRNELGVAGLLWPMALVIYAVVLLVRWIGALAELGREE
jgi:hypothetical protein